MVKYVKITFLPQHHHTKEDQQIRLEIITLTERESMICTLKPKQQRTNPRTKHFCS